MKGGLPFLRKRAYPQGRTVTLKPNVSPGQDTHVACAIQNLWLAARAEGLGLGWVSLFDPDALADLLELPDGAKPVAVLCLGHVEAFYERPILEEEGWTRGRPLDEMLFENRWGAPRHGNDPNEGEP